MYDLIQSTCHTITIHEKTLFPFKKIKQDDAEQIVVDLKTTDKGGLPSEPINNTADEFLSTNVKTEVFVI